MSPKEAPRHLAIIPDGNRRWAKKRNLPLALGHQQGAKRIEEISRIATLDFGIKYLTIWGGSYDNLTERSRTEIKTINRVYRWLADRMIKNKEIHENQARLRFLGEWPKLLEKDVIAVLREAEEKTKNYKNYYLTYLIGYNGDREMLDAINRLIKEGRRRISASLLKSYLWTQGLPEVDFLIRTGGEPHLSTGFMMWNTRYAQLYFSDKMWPDFGKGELERALIDYQNRGRRYGT